MDSFGLFCVLCLAGGLLYWYYRVSQDGFVPKVRAAIEKASQSNIPELSMVDLTDFTWDGLYIFGPYTPADDIEKQLGFSWPPAKDCGINLSDTFCLLVFTCHNKVVRYYEYPRGKVDFSFLGEPRKISVSEAVFSVEKKSEGTLVITLKERDNG
jgi:hypothetical protein